MSIWETLSQIDCSKHVEQKGKFSYLSWTWAIDMVKKHYPDMDHWPGEDVVYPDGTMEVRHFVKIEDQTRMMWLPVLDYRNAPIQNPNGFDVNTARMRCLTKNLAVNFGLGHYIYAGESLPAPSPVLQERFEELQTIVAKNDTWALRAFTEKNQPIMDNLFNMAKDGEKTSFKQKVRDCYKISNEAVKSSLAAFERIVGEGEGADVATEAWEEMSPVERHYVLQGMNSILQMQLQDLIGELETNYEVDQL